MLSNILQNRVWKNGRWHRLTEQGHLVLVELGSKVFPCSRAELHLHFSSNLLERMRERDSARASEHEQAKSTSSFLIMTTHKMEQKHGDRGSRLASNSACAQSGMRHSRSPHEMRVPSRESREARTRREAQTLTGAGHLSHRHRHSRTVPSARTHEVFPQTRSH
jgi:hypothetical protein